MERKSEKHIFAFLVFFCGQWLRIFCHERSQSAYRQPSLTCNIFQPPFHTDYHKGTKDTKPSSFEFFVS